MMNWKIFVYSSIHQCYSFYSVNSAVYAIFFDPTSSLSCINRGKYIMLRECQDVTGM